MFEHLQICDSGERRVVGLADAVLAVLTSAGRLVPTRQGVGSPSRILLLRLERIGDLLMTMGAIEAVRSLAPASTIDLVVGSWNEPVAQLIPHVDMVETLNASWLARDAGFASNGALVRRARRWRARRYDLAINFEADIRSNALLWLSRARRRVGFDSAGGGPLLTTRVAYDPREHVAVNALRLVEAAFLAAPGSLAASDPAGWRVGPLPIPDEARREAAALLAGLRAPLVGIHAGGGREIKQWDPLKFGELAARLTRERGASLILTGSAGDRAMVNAVRRTVPASAAVADLAGRLDLVGLAAVLARLTLLVTGDTGPMHLAAAMGTPVVAIFGPSDPARYRPLVRPHRVVRIDLPCSPCNRIRRPPARCTGREPDCLRGIGVEQVYAAVVSLIAEADPGPAANLTRAD